MPPWIILNSDNHVAHCIDPCLPSPSEITNNREKTRPNGIVGAASCNLDQVKGDEWDEVAKEKRGLTWAEVRFLSGLESCDDV